jgi:hypothetical protein
MGIFRGTIPQILQDLGVSGIEYQITVTLTPEQIRSLNTSPVDIVVPANANTIVVPGQCVFVGSVGTVAYSSAPDVQLQYSDTNFNKSLDGGSWDGSAAVVSVIGDAVGFLGTSAADLTPELGVVLQIIGGADVTDGDAACTIVLTYMSYDLTGLL